MILTIGLRVKGVVYKVVFYYYYCRILLVHYIRRSNAGNELREQELFYIMWSGSNQQVCKGQAE